VKEVPNEINRRNFLKSLGVAGLGSALAGVAGQSLAGETCSKEAAKESKCKKEKYPQVPKRELGKTGIEVPCLSLGAGHLDTQIILRNTLKWGVSYWDTSHSYVGGRSELNIGKYLTTNPEARKELVIVTKASGAKKELTPKAVVVAVEQRLQTSLERMNTKYIDLYYGVHGLSDPSQLTDELKQWAESAKKRKLIRFFGFSTHKNMAKNLTSAARLDWVDAIMTTYNFRLMQDGPMQAAIEACHKAGIGLIAMKTLARGQKFETEEDKKLGGHFLQRGFTEAQVKIKVVLEDKRISSACVGMNNAAFLTSNVAAAVDMTNLSQADMEVLREYAQANCSGYCASCADICDSALPDMPHVSDIMRYLMYYNSYGEKEMARELFAQVPGRVKSRLLSTDYRPAEARCPQHLPIGKLVAEAVSKLA